MREPWLWSLPLAGLGLGCQWLAGRHARSAWLVGLVDEAVWVVYAAWTRQWLFAASALAYGSVYVRNLLGGEQAQRASGWTSRQHARGGTPLLTRTVRRCAVAVTVPAVLGLVGCAQGVRMASGGYAQRAVSGALRLDGQAMTGSSRVAAGAGRTGGGRGGRPVRRRVVWRGGQWLVEASAVVA